MILYKNRLFILTIMVLAIFTIVIGCTDSKVKSKDKDTSAVTKVPVTTVEAENQTVIPTLDYSGTVEAWSQAALGSEIPGRIVSLNCEIGDFVRKDSLLAELGSENLIQARANYDAVKKDWERIKTLRKSGTVTQQAYDQMQAAYETAQAGYEKVLISTQIRAPFNGVITNKYLDVGEVYSLFPGQAGSPAIIELMQIDTIKVAVAVSENQYYKIALGQKAILRLDAYPDTQFVGKVSRIEPTINRLTRTANVEIQFDNNLDIIRPGMFGFVKISLPAKSVLLLNRDALIKQEGVGIFYVFKVQNNTAVRANIIKGDSFGGFVEIKSGLVQGDMVITTGKMKVKTGSSVQVVSSEVTK